MYLSKGNFDTILERDFVVLSDTPPMTVAMASGFHRPSNDFFKIYVCPLVSQ
jgi:hypothetical protein